MKTIKSNKGIDILVDDSDYNYLSKFNWHITTRGYARTRSGYKHLFMHVLLIDCPNGMVRDHKDRNKLNNQRKNLRIISRSQNCQNRSLRKTGSSKYKGVSIHVVDQKKNGLTVRWVSNIMVNGKRLPSRTFKNELDAAKDYNKKAKQIHGEYAVLNILK